jgi:hypothetical protein
VLDPLTSGNGVLLCARAQTWETRNLYCYHVPNVCVCVCTFYLFIYLFFNSFVNLNFIFGSISDNNIAA